MKSKLKFLAMVFAGLAVAGFLVAASGVIPITASSGHLPITEWFLSFTMRRSVATQSLGIQVPPLDDERLVLLGAGHFEAGCRSCHGSPDVPHPRIPQAMLPPPPNLQNAAHRWEPRELFYLVKHGIKFTGMPAWPALERDDEVWAVTAFLLELPELDATAYRQLVDGPASGQQRSTPLEPLADATTGPPAAAQSCIRCHGTQGQGRGVGAFPKLAGQSEVYLQAALQAYTDGERHSGIMEPIAAALSGDAILELARYYADLEPLPAAEISKSAEAIQRGRQIALEGVPNNRVPACSSCHGPDEAAKNPHYPVLAGQYADYLFQQLQLFHENKRGGSPYAHLMRRAAANLDEQQMRDLAAYYASQKRVVDAASE